MITSQAALRAAFWRDHPSLPRRRIRAYSGKGLMHCTDARCAFVDYVDMLARNGEITKALADRVKL